jgi:hypothetical protein
MSWRLEPSPRTVGIEEGLAAKVHDPLWLLGRQWQLGEFNGQDAGTPSLVQVAGTSATVNAWRGAQQTDWTPFDGATVPLDALVEPEDEPSLSLRERIEAGAHFRRLLIAAGLGKYDDAFVSAHAFDSASLADPAFAADLMLLAVAKRTADGAALLTTAQNLSGGQSSPVSIDAADAAAVQQVANQWIAWYSTELEPAPNTGTAVTWQENRLEYGFAVSSPASSGTVLAADAYLGDSLDWFDFDIDTSATAGPSADPTALSIKSVPAPVRYGGMPLPRFWAMEDSASDLGAIDASACDIGRLLLVQFGTVYGNDWFVLPIKLPAGSITILASVVVSDVFGRNLLLQRAGENDPQWNLFSLDVKQSGATHPAQNALFLPPTSGSLTESKPLETVLFLRDEVADLAWGVEALVQDGLESVLNRRALWQGSRFLPPGNHAEPSYIVETIVPDYWIPLAPEQLPGQQSLHLRLVPMEVDKGGVPTLVEPMGRLLAPDSDGNTLWVFDEEVPREGTQVDRVHRYMRWLSGRTVLWTARSRQTGHGEGSSGLRFDTLNPS